MLRPKDYWWIIEAVHQEYPQIYINAITCFPDLLAGNNNGYFQFVQEERFEVIAFTEEFIAGADPLSAAEIVRAKIKYVFKEQTIDS